MNHESELDADEREALRAWATCNVPRDFAARVVTTAETTESRREGLRLTQPTSWTAWWIGMVAAAAAILLALTLLAEGSEPDDPQDVAALREAARQVLLRECTPCHVRETTGAEPAAIAAFDLGATAWDAGLSSDQLALAVERVAEQGDANELAGVRRYVNAELGRRGAGAR